MRVIEGKSLLMAPGQGSQRPGMFVLAECIPEVRESYELADQISVELFGIEMIEGKNISDHAKTATQVELATNTVITQPLIVATSIGLIKHLKKAETFATAYGHSVNELSALYAAGCISEEDTIRLAMQRGQFCKEANDQISGGMAAFLNAPQHIKDMFAHEEGQQDDDGHDKEVVMATENSPDQFTISGPREKVTATVAWMRDTYQQATGLTKEQKRQLPNAVMLRVAGGFHSWMMRPAQKSYREALDNTEISVPTEMNYFSNYSHTYEGSPDTIRQHQENQLVKPVKFWVDIGKLVTDGHVRIVEAGAGSILTSELRLQQTKGNFSPNTQLRTAEEVILAKSA